jgi:protein-tyrosine phosphatase
MRVLFVCTGNIFRSVTAEYALRRLVGAHTDHRIASAGTDDYAHNVRPAVRDYLLTLGLDVSAHRRRTLTPAILSNTDLLVAMHTDHRAFMLERFEVRAPLFLELCEQRVIELPDVEDVIADPANNPAAMVAHVRTTIDRIVSIMPVFARKVGLLTVAS